MKSKEVVTLPASADALQEIVALAQQQIALESAVLDIENALQDAKAMLRQVQMEDLPTAMRAARLTEFTLESGEKLKLEHNFEAGIKVEDRPRAFAWLEAHDFDGLIKTEVVVTFGRGELELAEALALTLQKKKLNVELKRNIHGQTLTAWVRESDREKRKIPNDLFGVHPLDFVKIKLPKSGS